MKNYILETSGGDSFNKVAEKAKQIAKEKNVIVEFDFNGIKCLVNDKTYLNGLNRDYENAHIMEWKTIGYDCPFTYDYDTEIKLRTRQLKQARKNKLDRENYIKKQQKEENALKHKLKGIKFALIPSKKKEYKEYIENNSKDGYSQAVVIYADTWAKLMQLEIAKGKTIKECADKTQEPCDYLGITGFQYGCIIEMLSEFWKHGEELRKWHNKEYGVGEDKKGVVNPAILTVG